MLLNRDGFRWHPASKRLRRILRPTWFGTLRRLHPISRHWGFDRGQPVDRYYIERFLAESRADITGKVLEVKNSAYTQQFGSAVTEAHVLDIDPGNPKATIISDLANAHNIAAETFDCFILTQTLQLIFDLKNALTHAHRILKPGGVLLCTVPSVSRIARTADMDYDFWRLTRASCLALFGEVFGADRIQVKTHGNVLTAIAFLEGVAAEELRARELDTNDPDFPTLITIYARRSEGNAPKGS